MTATSLRVPVLMAVLAVLSACNRDPRKQLVELNVPYTTDAWLGQAGAGDKASVTAFLASGQDPNVRDAGGNTALMNAAAGGHVDVVRMLLEKGAQVNVKNESGTTALAAAILNDHAAVVGLLLDAGAEVNAPTVGRHPLMLAIRARRPQLVKQLLDKGAHAYIQDDQWSALMMASFIGDLDTVNALLAKDPNINSANDEGATALMHAASAGHAAVIRALLAKGAAMDAQDLGGITALMLAANNGHSDAAQALLEAGANAGLRSRTGATARTLGLANGDPKIAALLPDNPAGQAAATKK